MIKVKNTYVDRGPRGYIYTPVIEDNVLNYENDGGLPNPKPVDLNTLIDPTRKEVEESRYDLKGTLCDDLNARLVSDFSQLQEKRAVEYGVRRILGATSPILERIGASVGKVSNISLDDLDSDDDFAFFDDMVKEVKIASNGAIFYKGENGYDALTDCDWMIEIPRFYVKRETNGVYFDEWVCFEARHDYVPHELFRDGENGGYLRKVYIARYKTGVVAGKDVSRPGLFPVGSRHLASFRAAAQSKGEGWQQIDVAYVDAIQMLYKVRFAHLNSQNIFLNNATNYRYTGSDTAQVAETNTNR
ncbi:MAG: hypothetical protein ACRCWQ_12375, partial [Bacilli bacterium]